MYIGEFVSRDYQVGIPFSKLYRGNRIWLEVELRLVAKGNAHLDCVFVVEMLNFGSQGVRDKNVKALAVDRYDRVLVDIAKLIQLPQGMVLSSARSLVRLKSVNLLLDIIREPVQSPSVVLPILAVGDSLENREGQDGREILSGCRSRNLPSELVKSGTKVIEELPEQHPYNGVHSPQLTPVDVPRIRSILLPDHGVGLLYKSAQAPL